MEDFHVPEERAVIVSVRNGDGRLKLTVEFENDHRLGFLFLTPGDCVSESARATIRHFFDKAAMKQLIGHVVTSNCFSRPGDSDVRLIDIKPECADFTPRKRGWKFWKPPAEDIDQTRSGKAFLCRWPEELAPKIAG